MAAGKPVITTLHTTMALVVKEENCGCLVPFGDVNALRKCITALRDDPAYRSKLGMNGREAFETKYNWELMEAILENLYGDLLGLGSKHYYETTRE